MVKTRTGRFLLLLCLMVLALMLRAQRVESEGPPAVSIQAVPLSLPPGEAETDRNRLTIPLDRNLYRYDLSRYMEVYIEPQNTSGTVSPADRADTDSPFFRAFEPAQGQTHWGVHKTPVWFRILLKNDSDQPRALYASNLVDHLPFTIEGHGTIALYYRLAYDDASIVCTPSLSSRNEHLQGLMKRKNYAAVILGIYIALFLYNIFLAFTTREASYPPYLAGVAFFTLYLAAREFGLSLLGWQIASANFTMAAYLCMLIFAVRFFDIKSGERGLYAVFLLMLLFGFITMGAGIVSPAAGSVLRYIFSIFLMLYAFLITGRRFRRDRRKALLFTVSFAPPLICLFFSLTAQLQLIHYQEGSLGAWLGSNPGMYLQIALQQLLLALALGDAINREKQIALTARSEAADLQQKEALRERFILHLSHELRTSLMFIQGTLEGIAKRAPEATNSGPEDRENCPEELVEKVRKKVASLEGDIDNLLGFARIETDSRSLKSAPLELSSFLLAKARSWTPYAESRQIEYRIGIEEEEAIWSRSNAYLLGLIVTNLLSNAFKYTPPRGTIEVTLKADAAGGKRGAAGRLKVTNSGTIIPQEKREGLFRLFEQDRTAETGNGGAGVGLYLARRCAELLGGSLRFDDSRAETGLILSLPLSSAPAPEVPTAAAAEIEPNEHTPALPREEEKKRGSILLVEDNAELRNMIAAELTAEFHLMEAADGAEALRYFDAGKRPDLVLCDILMPGMKGTELFRQIRTTRRLSTPFIFLSAVGDENQKQALFDEGAVAFLQKPFSLSLLRGHIRNLLQWKEEERRREREELKSAVIALFDDRPPASVPALSDFGLSRREQEIAAFLREGLRDKEIATQMGLATSTISNYLQRIYRKTGTHSRSELLRLLLK